LPPLGIAPAIHKAFDLATNQILLHDTRLVNGNFRAALVPVLISK
jgi:hypothetical protein